MKKILLTVALAVCSLSAYHGRTWYLVKITEDKNGRPIYTPGPIAMDSRECIEELQYRIEFKLGTFECYDLDILKILIAGAQ